MSIPVLSTHNQGMQIILDANRITESQAGGDICFENLSAFCSLCAERVTLFLSLKFLIDSCAYLSNASLIIALKNHYCRLNFCGLAVWKRRKAL
jgi:hypothetical protein